MRRGTTRPLPLLYLFFRVWGRRIPEPSLSWKILQENTDQLKHLVPPPEAITVNRSRAFFQKLCVFTPLSCDIHNCGFQVCFQTVKERGGKSKQPRFLSGNQMKVAGLALRKDCVILCQVTSAWRSGSKTVGMSDAVSFPKSLCLNRGKKCPSASTTAALTPPSPSPDHREERKLK